MATNEIELDADQLAVVEASVDKRLLVIAGAGQGKTEVVVSRIDFLVREEDLSASEEVLVLSFSRAAVSAVRTRLDLRDVAAANVRTFDSFASLLLLGADIQPEGSFDARIRRATRLLNESETVPTALESLRHVVIDEVQDLVGDRADLVLAILDLLDSDAGVTALGDPLQGVFDFMLDDSSSQTTAEEVFDILERQFGCEPVALDKNYRARGRYPKLVVALGNKLREMEYSDEAEALLSAVAGQLPDRGDIERWSRNVSDGRKTAVLCTTNADVLRVSRYFNDHGIVHAVRRQAQDFGAARWIAGALGSLPGPKERRSEVEAAMERLLARHEIEQKWYELKAAEGRRREFDSLDLVKVGKLIKARAIPLTLTEPDLSTVIVSTIHRAKGLEFDVVYIVEPTWTPDDEDEWTKVCREYVALSRARDDIFRCELPKPDSMIRADGRLWGRFKEEVWSKRKRGKKWTKAIEFQYSDVETTYPAFSVDVNTREVQTTLQSADLVGHSITAELDESESTDESPSYLLFSERGMLVGRTSTAFDEAFGKTFRWLRSWPRVVDGLTLVSVETVAGDPRESEKAGLGSSGFWLVPRVTGLACPDLKTT